MSLLSDLSAEDWVHAFDREGKDLGYLTARDCDLLDLELVEALPSERYRTDPYVVYHATMAYERHVFSQPELNALQEALLNVYMIKRNERRAEEARQVWLGNMMIQSPKMYQEYMRAESERKAMEREQSSGIEWRAPSTKEEFEDVIKEIFGEEGPPEEEHEDEPRTVQPIDEVLPPEVLEGLRD